MRPCRRRSLVAALAWNDPLTTVAAGGAAGHRAARRMKSTAGPGSFGDVG
jgi:hypothetical protein